MRVRSCGCSLIFGNELGDDGCHEDWPTPSNFTWPALIAQRLGAEYHCHARAGSGNLQILERVLCHAALYPQDFFIIGWSWTERFDYVKLDPDPNYRDTWETICPWSQTSESNYYYRHFHSELKDKLQSLIYVDLAAQTLQAQGTRFFMTYMDPIMMDRRWHAPVSVTSLQDRIQPWMNDVDGKNFLEWSREQGHPITAASHPLEPAHAAWAELMWPCVQAVLLSTK